MSTKKDLKTLIEKSGYRVSYVANEIGINAVTLRLIAGGHRKTSKPVIKLLAQFFDVDEKDLGHYEAS